MPVLLIRVSSFVLLSQRLITLEWSSYRHSHGISRNLLRKRRHQRAASFRSPPLILAYSVWRIRRHIPIDKG